MNFCLNITTLYRNVVCWNRVNSENITLTHGEGEKIIQWAWRGPNIIGQAPKCHAVEELTPVKCQRNLGNGVIQ